jgi:polysaccharide biosynthesis transport protein
VMQSPLINGLKADIARLEAKLQESSINLGKNHPQTIRNEAELASLRAQLQTETRKITSSIDTTYQVSKQREDELRKSMAAQKTKVLELNKQRDELRVLRNDIDVAQRAFETISQRANQTNIESQNSQTNIAVLNAATPPNEPSKPRVLLNVLISIFMGILLGVGLALMLELANRKVRSADDLADALDLPVLGNIAAAGRMLKRSGGYKAINTPATSGVRA